jgi:hypothetical protein
VGEFESNAALKSVCKPIMVFVGDCCHKCTLPIGQTEQCRTDFIEIIYCGTILSKGGHYLALIYVSPEAHDHSFVASRGNQKCDTVNLVPNNLPHGETAMPAYDTVCATKRMRRCQQVETLMC